MCKYPTPRKKRSSNSHENVKLFVLSGSNRCSQLRGANGISSISCPFHCNVYISNGKQPITLAIRSRARLIVGTDIARARSAD